MAYTNPHLLRAFKAHGYTQKSIGKLLGIAHHRVQRVLSSPLDFLSLRQYIAIAYALDLRLHDVLFMALDINQLREETKAQWFAEGLDELPYFVMREHPDSKGSE